VAPVPAAEETATRAPRLLRLGSVLAVAVVLPALLVTLSVRHEPRLSVYDESRHVDYVRRISGLEVPRIGDRMERASLIEHFCRGVVDAAPPACPAPDMSTEDMYAVVGAGGYQHEAQQPPTYYLVTALLRLPFAIGVGFVTSARLTGMFWLSAGLLLFYAAGRKFGARHTPTLMVTALLAASPLLLAQSSTVNNDAASFLVGAVALLLLLRLDTDRRPAAWIVGSLIAAFLVLLKPVALPVFAAVGILLVLWETTSRRRALVRVALFLVGPVVVYRGWEVVRNARSTASYTSVIDRLVSFKQVSGFPRDDLFASLGRFLGVYDNGTVRPGIVLPTGAGAITGIAMLAAIVVLSGGMWWLLSARPLSRTDQVGVVGLASLVLLGPTYVTLFYLEYSVKGGAQPRYGLAFLPLLGLSLAAAMRTRRQVLLAAVLAGLLVGVEIVVLL
jgi:hypothetical protein